MRKSLVVFLFLVSNYLAGAIPASASHQFLMWNEGGSSQITLGANQAAIVYMGTMEYFGSCPPGGVADFLYPWTDVYVVKSGTATVGATLKDESGSANPILGTSDGLFIDEMIAVTKPTGNLGSGVYDVVYDECEDGIRHSFDPVFPSAITVVIPSNIPALPNAEIARVKSAASIQEQHWRDIHTSYEWYFRFMDLLEAIKGTASLKEVMEETADWAAGIWSEEVERAEEAARDALGIPVEEDSWVTYDDFIGRAKEAALTHILNTSRHYGAIAADPPDPDFRQLTPLKGLVPLEPNVDDSVLTAAVGLGSEASNESAISEALLHALERYQGAKAAGEGQWALIHARQIRDYSEMLSRQVPDTRAAIDQLSSSTVSDPREFDDNMAGLEVIRQHVEAEGFSDDQVRVLRNLGLTPDSIADLDDDFVNGAIGDFTLTRARVLAPLSGLSASADAFAGIYSDLSAAMAPIITGLAADPLSAVDQPSAGAGGPYAGTEGTAITFAAGTVSTISPVTAYAWDLDGDGSFDDGAGSTASFTYNRPGHSFVGLKITNAAGYSGISYAEVDIADSNRRPAIVSYAPAASAAATVGATLPFSVVASDADSDPLTVKWFIDGLEMHTGSNFNYVPTAGDIGVHVVQVQVEDSSANSGMATHTWFMSVYAVDVDGDLWTANIDCDDSNGAVNPGASEILGNGLDDDCNPLTTDSAPVIDTAVADQTIAEGQTRDVYVSATDPEGDPLTITLAGAPSFVTLTDLGGGVAIVHLRPGFSDAGNHPDIQVTVSDGTGAAIDTFSVTVTNTNRPPVANGASYTTENIAPLSITLTGSDPDLDPIAFQMVTPPAHGTLIGSGVNVTYVADSHYQGADSFTFKAVDPWGAESAPASVSLTVTTTNRPPVADFKAVSTGRNVALLEAGATVHSYSSRYDSSHSPEAMLNGTIADRPWATTGPTNQWTKILLAGGKSYTIDRIAIRPRWDSCCADQRVKDFAVDVSTTTADDAAFTTVLTGTAANNQNLQFFALPEETQAKYVRYRPLNNRGSCCYISTHQFKVYTSEESNPQVSFKERASDPEGDPLIYRWNFGDGVTSTSANPDHTYTTDGTYDVSLRVTDLDGNIDTYTQKQVIFQPLTVTTAAQASTVEGALTAYWQTSTAPTGAAILSRVWTWGDGTITNSDASPVNFAYPDNGPQKPVFTAFDNRGLQADSTEDIQITNAPPTVSAGSNRTVEWGPSLSAGSADDPSSVDRTTLQSTWDWGDGTVENFIGQKSNPGHVYQPGTYSLRVSARDKDGGTADAGATITVNKRNTTIAYTGATVARTAENVTISGRVNNTYGSLTGLRVTVNVGPYTYEPALTSGGNFSIVDAYPADTYPISIQFAGNAYHNSSSGNSTLIVYDDFTAPVTTPNVAGTYLEDGWITSDAVVTLTATDNPGGSGVQKTEYSLNGGRSWTTYSAPFTISKAGSNLLYYRSIDRALNQESVGSTHVKIDKTPLIGRIESGQGGLDWLSPAVTKWTTNNSCMGCHVQGVSLYGMSVSTASGYSVNNTTTTFLTDKVNQGQNPTSGAVGRYFNYSGYEDYPNTLAAFVSMGLAGYDKYVGTSRSSNLVKLAGWIIPRQQSNGRWVIEHNEAPVDQGDIMVTGSFVEALVQAKQRVDTLTGATYQNSIDKAVTWLKAQTPVTTQDKAYLIMGLKAAGLPDDDPKVAAVRDDLLNSQRPDYSWRENTGLPAGSSFATGQTLYALCKAGVSIKDPRVDKGINWLIHSQMNHVADSLVPTSMPNGPWTEGDRYVNTDAGRPSRFLATLWPVIALGCYGDLGVEMSVDPTQREISAFSTDPQTVSYTVSVTNNGTVADDFTLGVSGGMPGWTATLSATTLSLESSESSDVTLTVTAPPNQPANLPVYHTISAVSKTSASVSTLASVTTYTNPPPPTAGHATKTVITAGNGATASAGETITLRARVTDDVDKRAVSGPNKGIVTFFIAGAAVGADDDSDGDGNYEIDWRISWKWNYWGGQDLRAVYSGIDLPGLLDTDLLPSFASGTVNLFRPVNNAPTAEAGGPYVADEGSGVTLDASGSSDPDGNTLTYKWELGAEAWTTQLVPDLKRQDDWSGTATLTVDDGREEASSDTASVTFNNVAPLVSAGTISGTKEEGSTVSLDGFSFTDPGRLDTHEASIDWGDGTAPSAGDVDESNGSGTVAGNHTYSADGTYEVEVCVTDDDGGRDCETVQVIIENAAPTADDQRLQTEEDTAVAVILSGSDPGSDPLSFDVTGSPAHGSVSGTAPNVTYTPFADFNGTDSFSFKVNDGDGAEDYGTVTVDVTPVNDPPVLAPVGDQVIDEGDASEILISATDVDDAGLSFSAAGLPGFAGLTDNGDNTATLRLDPDYDDSGDYPGIVLSVSDGDASDSETLSIKVNDVNRPPAAVAADLATSEDVSLNITLAATDPDGDTLEYTRLSSPANGTISGTGSTLTYAPDADFNGEDSFVFKVQDGKGGESVAEVHIRVDPVNDAPVANVDEAATEEDKSVAVDVLANDTDVEDSLLSIESFTFGSHGTVVDNGGGKLTYHPDQDYNGSDSFTYVAVDAGGATSQATVNITVTPVNDAPTITPLAAEIMAETETRPVTVSAFDIDGDPITLSASGLPPFAGFTDNGDGTGTLVFAPGYDDAGSYEIEITAADGGSSVSATMSLLVTNTNRPPSAAPLSLELDEDTSITASLPGSDLDGDPLVYTISAQPVNGIVIAGGGSATYIPFLNYSGTDSFSYRVTDTSGATAEAIVDINVRPVNDRSATVADSASANEDESVVIDVLANDSDADGDPLTVISVTQPSNGSATVNGDGTVTYTPAANFNGADAFVYIASDGNGSESTADVAVSVIPVNDPPLASAGSDISINEGDVISLIGSGWDLDGDTLQYSWSQVSGPTAPLTDANTYEPTITAPQVDGDTVLTLNLTVSDGSATSTDTVNVTVRNVVSGYENARTIGFWKNHPDRIAAILARGSINLGDTTVTTVSQAVSILTAANAKDARYQLRAQLLATLLNLRNSSNPLALASGDIRPVTAQAVEFLATHSMPVNSAHPDRSTAISLKDKLDAYNNSGE